MVNIVNVRLISPGGFLSPSLFLTQVIVALGSSQVTIVVDKDVSPLIALTHFEPSQTHWRITPSPQSHSATIQDNNWSKNGLNPSYDKLSPWVCWTPPPSLL